MIGSHDITTDLVPAIVPDIIAEVVDAERLVYPPGQTEALHLTATAGMIWGLCDGRRSVGKIIAILQGCFKDPGGTLSQDVVAILAELRESGVVALD
jgi:hypothetical protein